MVSIATLQRTLAVLGVMLGLCYGEYLLFVHAKDVLPGLPGRVLLVVCAFGVLGVFSRLTTWERRRRRLDEEAVQRVVEAARSLGVEVPEDRAIFPLFYRGHRKSRAPAA